MIDGESPMNRISVLDHGFVRLVDHMGTDVSVVRAARVSYDAAWDAGNDEKGDVKLLKYLWKNRHTTPFESVTFTFEVKAPIFVLRQWHRHRTWSYNELSGRYRELPAEFYVPHAQVIGEQSSSNKQGRQASALEREVSLKQYTAQCISAFSLYNILLKDNWPKELARNVLPVATYSHMFATVNLLNLLKFFTLRCDPHAQYEIRMYAGALKELVKQHVPVTISAWEEFK